ncbi:kynureninase [Halobacillus karajensis]|uniref:Kynureninase n=1 Tax=Halobacillus karajensis TaxID=195088 RepID=A0A024P3H2_9BACI|nr:kynureninase [Halobacillus karajensis]CDQ18729.1 Kynureninase [Halobacillus karajensis]CDQ23199.1 Kynureninase [Halobacillus karajensis]CDQ26681.1 Kynureninase [Halobacillus karajensis]
MANSLITRDYVKILDQEDPLQNFKDEFYQEGFYYMDGNSLGLLSRRSENTLASSLQDWKQHAIEGWTEGNEPWFYMSEKIGAMTAPLIGAKPEEVINTGSITSNLHQLFATFYKPEGKRTKVLADTLNFPSDIYAIKSQIHWHGLDPNDHLIQVHSEDGYTLDEDKIIEKMNEDIAILLLPSVLYRSGQLLDMEKITKAAHHYGIIVGFDLAHSIGALPHRLSEWGVDFAVWCTYKYLNSGPGGVGGLYVNERHLGNSPGLAGWFSSDKNKQFDMSHDLTPAESAGAFQLGTPHILSSAPLIGSLELFSEAGIENVREKSLRLTRLLMDLIQQELSGYGFKIANPSKDDRRGGHVCLIHEEAASICKALKQEAVIPDFRSPNVIRLAPIAFYTSYEDVYEVVLLLKDIVKNEKQKQFKNERDIIA